MVQNTTVLDKDGFSSIVQLPLPPSDLKKDNEIASKLLKAKSFNDSKMKKLGSNMTEKRIIERQNSTANESSRFQIGESISSSEIGDGPFNLIDSEDCFFKSYE